MVGGRGKPLPPLTHQPGGIIPPRRWVGGGGSIGKQMVIFSINFIEKPQQSNLNSISLIHMQVDQLIIIANGDLIDTRQSSTDYESNVCLY